MAAKKVGALIKEARTAAGLTQEKLASKAGEGLTAKDISNCENGKADLTTAQLKKIAVACGVTQTSLVNAPKNTKAGSESKSSKKTTSTAKTASSSSKKTTSASKKSSESSSKTTAKKPAVPANANTSMKVTSAEVKLIEAYRTAKSDNKKIALKILKGELSDTAVDLLGAAGGSSDAANSIGDFLGNALGNLLGNK